MTVPPTPLPTFKYPPIQELALSVQFTPLAGLRAAHLGLLWSEFRDRFPVTQDQPPLPHIVEEFGARRHFKVGLDLRTFDTPPLPRCWFLNEAGSQLIQVQNDRLIHNWRKVDDGDEYPRFSTLRGTFRQEIEQFSTFIQREGLGEFVPDQCEVTYVDQLVAGQGWERHGQLERVLSTWSGQYSTPFLSEPEAVELTAHFVIPNSDGTPVGRLHIRVEPALLTADDTPTLLVRTTARGRPQGERIDGVMAFLDLGHEWAVRGFLSITTPQLHEHWK
jgi:uncharacterized protein (TIGR04255 family)